MLTAELINNGNWERSPGENWGKEGLTGKGLSVCKADWESEGRISELHIHTRGAEIGVGLNGYFTWPWSSMNELKSTSGCA